MTFRDDAQLDTGGVSSGGGRGPKMALGGGIGGIVVVVIAVLLGVNPNSLLGGSDGGGSTTQVADNAQIANCRTGADANNNVACRIVATKNSLDAVWATQLPKAGVRYQPPNVRLFSGAVNTGCGQATSAVGPFYCPPDHTAYFDTGFFQDLKTQYGASGGPLAQEYVVAHEFGHAIQNQLGTIGRAQQDPKGATSASVRTELQADCYAGIWAHWAARTPAPNGGPPILEPLSQSDIDDALSAAAAVGDDRIQKQATGRVNPESWTHGSSAERQKWFTTGYQTGDVGACDTFRARSLG
ncbi:hypothetical protein G4X40_14130 [Rhodococcus sp. D2-41]|uniref:Neutral zinc metallopeptidase n=1 Tax=Speluncibacter jeojiensis TaxID=2710754 RepID=A0A9X4M5X9_9ACTN|nr:neutral zinc metallopeptidase [Rhodococcus sp. D2-41]MDG3011290.1 hypothetical protein [Rhodococcus sp. D2-41]MDG3015858.1 neutral zinc metallopeptidase [Corynebacteriales bacterium D3-21]